ncbi:MAG TPA: polysaccharide biosynthesis/export family protein [Kofleriaceae bacterium]|nr:polysaccharide biosynthesis/export family protein [Kofleriaceae bacterium]
MTRQRMAGALIALAAALAACGGSTLPAYDYAKEPDPRKTEYVIGVGDRLIITVWRNADLATEATVRPDGTVTMPLVGDLKTVGRTPSSIRDEITKKLAVYISDKSAVVTVAVAEVNSYRFTVSGEVVQPGVFASAGYVTVADAVAMAGGFTRYAKKDEMFIMRSSGGAPRKIPIDYKAVASGTRPDANLAVISGDIIVVP